MSNEKFTPGPWALTEEYKHLPYRQSVYTIADGITDDIICHSPLTEEHPGCLVNWEANAKLIAAAPDLFAACVEFCRKVEAGEARSTASYEQMKAAIEKATE
jgi:hypothetical protein